MRKILSTVWGRLLAFALVLALVIGVTVACYLFWYDQQIKFHSVQMELGGEKPELEMFLTEQAIAQRCRFVTDLSAVDLSAAGVYDIVLAQDDREETVTLTVKDTVAPVAVFQDLILQSGEVPQASDFVVSVDDLSETTVDFVREFPEIRDYQDKNISVIVKDASGNAMTGVCTVRFVWLKESATLELGQVLTKADLLLAPEKDDALIDQAQLDQINGSPVGTYTVTSTSGNKTQTVTVTVQDTTGPVLKLQEVKRNIGKKATVEDFVKEATDLSGEVTLTMLTEPDFDKAGTQTVQIEAKDIFGNVTVAETTLFISNDTTGPKFTGLKAITIDKHSKLPDMEKGVKAKDAKDGVVDFTYNTSKVNVDKAGTYYVTYTAKDKSGNVTNSKRKVTVNPDKEDTAALVASIAKSLPNDPVEIRNYVKKTIRYSSNWGGDDPTWFGLTQKHGNCYVHAKVLQDILILKGWTTKLIWVTGPKGYEKSHYWLQIYINGGWKHIDATPSNLHGRYPLMNDAQRYETLVKNGKNRDWDRSMWPACN